MGRELGRKRGSRPRPWSDRWERADLGDFARALRRPIPRLREMLGEETDKS